MVDDIQNTFSFNVQSNSTKNAQKECLKKKVYEIFTTYVHHCSHPDVRDLLSIMQVLEYDTFSVTETRKALESFMVVEEMIYGQGKGLSLLPEWVEKIGQELIAHNPKSRLIFYITWIEIKNRDNEEIIRSCDILKKHIPDMSQMDTEQVCRIVKNNPQTLDIKELRKVVPKIFSTVFNKG